MLYLQKSKEKADGKVHGKDEIHMNTAMIFGYLKNEQYDEALDSNQGLVLAYTFLRERKRRLL